MLVIKNEIIHSLVYRTIFIDKISYSCQLCMMYFVKNNRNKTNINENYFTELTFPSSTHKIHVILTTKKNDPYTQRRCIFCTDMYMQISVTRFII